MSKGKDIFQPLIVSLEETYNGTMKKASVHRNIICEKCQGVGGTFQLCPMCNGTGIQIQVHVSAPENGEELQCVCPQCCGRRECISSSDYCETCWGKKVIMDKQVLEVRVEQGMVNGQKIVFKGKGDQMPGAEAGDVVVILNERKHEVYNRSGNDLIMKLNIQQSEALHGFRRMIKTLDNRELDITIAPGEITKYENVKCIPNEGMPVYNNPFERGVLLILLLVNFPFNPLPQDAYYLSAWKESSEVPHSNQRKIRQEKLPGVEEIIDPVEAAIQEIQVRPKSNVGRCRNWFREQRRKNWLSKLFEHMSQTRRDHTIRVPCSQATGIQALCKEAASTLEVPGWVASRRLRGRWKETVLMEHQILETDLDSKILEDFKDLQSALLTTFEKMQDMHRQQVQLKHQVQDLMDKITSLYVKLGHMAQQHLPAESSQCTQGNLLLPPAGKQYQEALGAAQAQGAGAVDPTGYSNPPQPPHPEDASKSSGARCNTATTVVGAVPTNNVSSSSYISPPGKVSQTSNLQGTQQSKGSSRDPQSSEKQQPGTSSYGAGFGDSTGDQYGGTQGAAAPGKTHESSYARPPLGVPPDPYAASQANPYKASANAYAMPPPTAYGYGSAYGDAQNAPYGGTQLAGAYGMPPATPYGAPPSGTYSTPQAPPYGAPPKGMYGSAPNAYGSSPGSVYGTTQGSSYPNPQATGGYGASQSTAPYGTPPPCANTNTAQYGNANYKRPEYNFKGYGESSQEETPYGNKRSAEGQSSSNPDQFGNVEGEPYKIFQGDSYEGNMYGDRYGGQLSKFGSQFSSRFSNQSGQGQFEGSHGSPPGGQPDSVHGAFGGRGGQARGGQQGRWEQDPNQDSPQDKSSGFGPGFERQQQRPEPGEVTHMKKEIPDASQVEALRETEANIVAPESRPQESMVNPVMVLYQRLQCIGVTPERYSIRIRSTTYVVLDVLDFVVIGQGRNKPSAKIQAAIEMNRLISYYYLDLQVSSVITEGYSSTDTPVRCPEEPLYGPHNPLIHSQSTYHRQQGQNIPTSLKPQIQQSPSDVSKQ